MFFEKELEIIKEKVSNKPKTIDFFGEIKEEEKINEESGNYYSEFSNGITQILTILINFGFFTPMFFIIIMLIFNMKIEVGGQLINANIIKENIGHLSNIVAFKNIISSVNSITTAYFTLLIGVTSISSVFSKKPINKIFKIAGFFTGFFMFPYVNSLLWWIASSSGLIDAIKTM